MSGLHHGVSERNRIMRIGMIGLAKKGFDTGARLKTILEAGGDHAQLSAARPAVCGLDNRGTFFATTR